MVLITGLLAPLLLYQQFTGQIGGEIEGLLTRELEEAAADAAGRIDGDRLREVYGARQADTPEYRALATVLRSVKNRHHLSTDVYTLHLDVLSGFHDDGIDPEYQAPYIMLRMSEDGGKSFDGVLKERLWREGESGRVIFRQLGSYERAGAVAEVSYWAGLVTCVLSAVINGAEGST